VFVALAVAALIWYFAQGSVRENLGKAGRFVVFAGWAVLIVLCFVALANLVDCSLRF
jgi:hypothetical protein